MLLPSVRPDFRCRAGARHTFPSPRRILSNAPLLNDSSRRRPSRVTQGLRRSLSGASATAIARCVIAACVIAACGTDAVVAPQPKATELHPLERLIVAATSSIAAAAAAGPATLGFSTYDGSGQVVHPDVVGPPRSLHRCPRCVSRGILENQREGPVRIRGRRTASSRCRRSPWRVS